MKSEKSKRLKMTVIASVITAIFVFSTAAVVIADDHDNNNEYNHTEGAPTGDTNNVSTSTPKKEVSVEQSIKDAAPKKNNAASNGPRVRNSDYSASTSSGESTSSSSSSSSSGSSSGESTSSSSGGSTTPSTPIFTPTELPKVPPKVYLFTTTYGCYQRKVDGASVATNVNSLVELYESMIDYYSQDDSHWLYLEFSQVIDKFAGPAMEKINSTYCNEGQYVEQTIVINQDGTAYGVYSDSELEQLNPSKEFRDYRDEGYYWTGYSTVKGDFIKLPNGITVEVLDNVYYSPLVFDLTGDGVKTTNKTIMYDMNGDGKLDKIHDIDRKDGILVLGKGKNGLELFGDNTDLNKDGKPDKFANGFEALKALARKDKLINDKDDMKLDANDIKILEKKYKLGMKTKGYKGKIHTLTSLGITEIRLGKPGKETTKSTFDSRGNIIMDQEGTGFTIHKKNNVFVDVWHKILNAVKAAINGVQKMFS